MKGKRRVRRRLRKVARWGKGREGWGWQIGRALSVEYISGSQLPNQAKARSGMNTRKTSCFQGNEAL